MCHLFIYSLLLLLKQIFKIKKKKEGRYKMKHRSEIEKGRGERVKKFKKIEEGPATNSLFRRRSNGGIPFPFRTHRCFCSAPSLHFTVSSIYVWFSILFPFFFLFSSHLISSMIVLSISVSSVFCWLCRPISEDEWLFEKNIEGKCSREISPFCDYSNTSSSILTTSDASSHTPPLERLLFLTYPCRHQLMLNVMLHILTSFS